MVIGPRGAAMTSAPGDADVRAAYAAALAAEQRAVYGYALVGPRLDAAGQQQARQDADAHATLEATAAAAVTALGGTPAAPRPDYPELYPVDSPASARARAVELEDACAQAWRSLYARLVAAGTAGAAGRAAAQQALTGSAVRASAWRAGPPTVAFPGIG